jgi:hypothetical protein
MLNFTTALNSTGGTNNLGHNWWGTYSGSAPAGLDAAAWAARLGSPVSSWADGSGTAVLGSAQLTGGSGTAVVVSHGRANWPFGVGIIGSADMMCSDYYDFFVVNGSGLWEVTVPVDDNAGCNLNTLAGLRLYWITDIAECAAPTSQDCWDLLQGNVTAVGQNLVASNIAAVDLGGTPFVAGDSGGFEPTAITLQSLQIKTAAAPLWLSLLFGIVLAGLTITTTTHKRRS